MHAHPTQASPSPPARPARRPGRAGPGARPGWRRDLSASAVVSLVAMPLSMGIALAAGAPLQAGLIAVAVGALVTVALGDARPGVAAAAIGVVMVAAELAQRYGWRVLCAVTAIVGLTQLALGAARVARALSAMSPAVAHGLIAGTGISLALGQLPVVLGGGSPGLPSRETLTALPSALARPEPSALLMCALTAAVLVGWPRLPGRAGRWARLVPASLAAVALATGASLALAAALPSLPSWEDWVLPALPKGPVLGVFAAVLTIALVITMEPLLLAGAIRPTGSKNPPAGSGPLGSAWVLLWAVFLTAGRELIPLASLATLVVVAGARMAGVPHRLRSGRQLVLYAIPLGSVVFLGVLQGLLISALAATLPALARLPHALRHLRDFRHRRTQPSPEADDTHMCRPWTPWRNHDCVRPAATGPAPVGEPQLLGGVSAFQRDTAPLVRDELARLAREGQRPSQLFLTCADSRLVTSMITSSGPGDLFTVRNVGNLMPPPDGDGGCDSVGAAVEYAVDVLKVGSITVCGHSGCGAMQALLDQSASPARHSSGAGDPTPLTRWLRHGRPSLARMQRIGRLGRGEVALAERPVADDVERLALVNVLQQLDHLMAHPCVARRVAEGSLRLQGMYFHVGEAQAYVLDQRSRTFAAVRPGVRPGVLDTV